MPIPPPVPVPLEYRFDHGMHTYLIASEGSPLVKIGKARAPWNRLADLQTGNPQKLTLLWAAEGDHESYLHTMFWEQRVTGEWFDLTSLGVDPVAVVAATLPSVVTTATVLADYAREEAEHNKNGQAVRSR